MNRPIVHRFPDAASVANGVALAVVDKLNVVLSKKPVAHFVVTGGTVGIATLAQLDSIDTSSVDWSRVHIWWGDERFVARDSDDRNAKQARNAWLSRSDVPEHNIHEFPAVDDDLTLEQAREAFALELKNTALDGQDYPSFDLLLLGMGPDGHVASLFPGHVYDETQTVVAIANSPKPPPMRLSLNFDVICAADEVWFTVAGADKAEAVATAFGDDSESLPVGRVHGVSRTVWFVDQTAGVRTWGC